MFETSGYYDETFIQSTKYYFFFYEKEDISECCVYTLAGLDDKR